MSGAHHAVDSCEYSFQLAAEGAIKQGTVFFTIYYKCNGLPSV